MNDEFWMPLPATLVPGERSVYDFTRLSPKEVAVLRRLMYGEPLRKRYRQTPARDRAVLRRRRRLLMELGIKDLRNLAQILLELGL